MKRQNLWSRYSFCNTFGTVCNHCTRAKHMDSTIGGSAPPADSPTTVCWVLSKESIERKAHQRFKLNYSPCSPPNRKWFRALVRVNPKWHIRAAPPHAIGDTMTPFWREEKKKNLDNRHQEGGRAGVACAPQPPINASMSSAEAEWWAATDDVQRVAP